MLERKGEGGKEGGRGKRDKDIEETYDGHAKHIYIYSERERERKR